MPDCGPFQRQLSILKNKRKENGNERRVYTVVYSPYVHKAELAGEKPVHDSFFFQLCVLHVQLRLNPFLRKAHHCNERQTWITNPHLSLTSDVFDVTASAFLQNSKKARL
jgi:hypothetical protein